MQIFKLLEFRRHNTNTEPKKVLPVSPINNLAGCQFKIKKPINGPNNTKYVGSTSTLNTSKKTTIQLPTNPSRPSIKLIKFITPVERIK